MSEARYERVTKANGGKELFRSPGDGSAWDHDIDKRYALATPAEEDAILLEYRERLMRRLLG